jgi:hypothetical protein
MTRMDEAVYLLADRLKDYHEDNRPELPGVYCDLLGAALCEVNWREIAKHLLENIEVEA